MKELEPRLADLPVQLVSVSFTSSEVPSSNGYNTLVCGPVATPIVEVLGQDKSSVGYCAATSTNEIYDAFLLRRNKVFFYFLFFYVSSRSTSSCFSFVPGPPCLSLPLLCFPFSLSLTLLLLSISLSFSLSSSFLLRHLGSTSYRLPTGS